MTDLAYEAVEIGHVGVDIAPMHFKLCQFFIRRELGVLVGVGPSEVGLEVVPEGPVHHGHAHVSLLLEPSPLVPGPGVDLWPVHVRQTEGHFKERGGELPSVTIDKLVACKLVQEQLGLVAVSIEDWRLHSRECATSAITGGVDWGWYWCACRGADVFQATRIRLHGGGGCNEEWGRGSGDWWRCVCYMARVAKLGVGFRPMAKAELVVVIDLVIKP